MIRRFIGAVAGWLVVALAVWPLAADEGPVAPPQIVEASEAVSSGIPATVEDVSGRDYLPAVLPLLEGAQRTIILALYELDWPSRSPNHPVAQLVEALAAAKRRGVEVTVVLNRDQVGHYPLFTRNDAAMAALQAAGITPVTPPPGLRLHDKVLVVDKEIVVLGSTNWSYAALMRNSESAVLIRSPAYAGVTLARLGRLPVRPAPAFVAQAYDAVPIPNAFLHDPRFLARIVRAGDERLFDLALQLYALREEAGEGSAQVIVPPAVLATAAGLPASWSEPMARRQLTKLLDKLDHKYQMIWVARADEDGPYDITLRDLEDPTKPYLPPTGHDRPFPRAYWRDGWPRRLSLPAKAAYLVALRRAAQSGGPWFQASLSGMAGDAGVRDARTLRRGFEELQREEIVEIVVVGPDDARYRLNGLPAP